MGVVEKDLEYLGAQNWREIIQNRDKWSDLVIAVKTLREVWRPEEGEGEEKDTNLYSYLGIRPNGIFGRINTHDLNAWTY